MLLASHGGQAAVGADGYVAGAPEWVGEVSGSNKGGELTHSAELLSR